MKDAVIFGYSGHAYVMIEILIANQYNILGYIDNERKEKDPFEIDYLGTEYDEAVLNKIKTCSAFIGIGNNKLRSEIFKKLQNEFSWPVAIHPKSIVSPTAKINSGTVIMAGAVINALATIGKAVICNSSSIVEHDCIVGDYAHIAPGAVLAGNVTIGKNSFIGANSVIRQGLTIGSDVIIGAGSVVIKNVADGLTIYGNPSKSD